jgi:hypothetical protein
MCPAKQYQLQTSLIRPNEREAGTRSGHVLAFFVALFAFSPTAAAQEVRPLRAELTWTAPAECIQRTELEHAIEALVGHAIFHGDSDAEPDVLIDGEAGQDGERWAFRFVLRRPGGEPLGDRTIRRTGECRSLDRAASIVLALMVDQTREEFSLELPDEPITAPPAPAPAPQTRRSWSFTASVFALGDLGTLPSPVVGPGLEVSLLYRDLIRLSVDASWLPPVEATENAGAGGRFQLWQVGLGACVAILNAASIGLDACGALQAGALVSQGVGLSDPGREANAVWSVLTGPRVGWTRGPLELWALAGVIIPGVRDEYVRDEGTADETQLHRTSKAVGRLQIGIGFRPF